MGGVIYVGVKHSYQKITLVYSHVCKDKLVAEFDGTVRKSTWGDDSTNKIASDVKRKIGWDTDPSCLYMVAYDTAQKPDIEETKKLVAKLEELSRQGLHEHGDLAYYMQWSTFVDRAKSWAEDKGAAKSPKGNQSDDATGIIEESKKPGEAGADGLKEEEEESGAQPSPPKGSDPTTTQGSVEAKGSVK
jgi:hypothetical protein